MCLRGASELQKEWLEKDERQDIAVFVVWSPQLGSEPKHVAEAAELMPDPRAKHYWDGSMAIGSQYQEMTHPDGTELNLSAPAWDVWLLFEPDTVWESDKAPEPLWWAHQLRGLPEDIRLDPERFAAKAMAIEIPPPK